MENLMGIESKKINSKGEKKRKEEKSMGRKKAQKGQKPQLETQKPKCKNTLNLVFTKRYGWSIVLQIIFEYVENFEKYIGTCRVKNPKETLKHTSFII